MAEIVLDNISKQFPDGTWAVRDVSFTVHDGEFFILVGPSGCGKSTLLNLIAGLEDISQGELRVAGRRMNEVDAKDRNMAMVFQSYAIYPHMSVAENLAFPLRMAGVPGEEIATRVGEIAAMLNLAELLQRKPSQLSGGQRQRVAMGRAIVRRPQAFLLDEPLSNLDAQLRLRMRAEIARLQSKLGTTMVYVTHDQTEAMTLGDSVAVLNKGRVQQVGTPSQLYHRPANLFVAGFIGAPPMNMLPARRRADALQCLGRRAALSSSWAEAVPDDDRPLILGVRPEHWRMVEGDEASTLSVMGAIEVLEWTGADLYAHVRVALGHDVEAGADQSSLIVRLDPASEFKEGQSVCLGVQVRNMHLFDAHSGLRIV